MCGISGIVSLDNASNSVLALNLRRMTSLLRHRGPDDEGYLLIDAEKKSGLSYHGEETIPEIKLKTPALTNELQADVGFGFRRLSIIDLSANGHQPMKDEAAGNWIIFNGEIYNYIELRDERSEERRVGKECRSRWS